MASYMFTVRGSRTDKQNMHGIIGVSDHEVVASLDDVDRFVAAWWGEDYDEKVFCPRMEQLTEVGFCALLNESGCYIGEDGTRPARSKAQYWNLKEDEPERPMDHLGYLNRIDWLTKRDGEDDLHHEARNAAFKAFLHHMFYVRYRFHGYG